MISSGHTLYDILDRVQPGFPYPGWTFPQFQLWIVKANRYVNRLIALQSEMTRLAIASCLDSKGISVRQLNQKLRNLRTS